MWPECSRTDQCCHSTDRCLSHCKQSITRGTSAILIIRIEYLQLAGLQCSSLHYFKDSHHCWSFCDKRWLRSMDLHFPSHRFNLRWCCYRYNGRCFWRCFSSCLDWRLDWFINRCHDRFRQLIEPRRSSRQWYHQRCFNLRPSVIRQRPERI